MVLGWIAALACGQEAPAAPSGESAGFAATFTDNFQLRYWRIPQRLPDPDDVAVFDYVDEVNRLNFALSKGPWAFELQLDETALFLDRYYLDDVLYVERELHASDLYWPFPGDEWYANPEKIRFKYETPKTVFTIGDSYAAFGRGIAINLNRNVDIDVDTSIQGVKGVFRPGAWDLTFVAGQLNRQQVQQDNPNADVAVDSGIHGDYRHDVAAVEAIRYGLGPANVGAHGVFYKFVPEPGLSAGFRQMGDPSPTAGVGGATVELTGVGGIDWYGEGDVFGYNQLMPQPLPDSDSQLGYAGYLSASAYPGPFVLLVEGKRYYEADRVNAPLTPENYRAAIAPTLEYERAVTEDTAAALTSNDIWGARTQLDWAAIPAKLTPYVAMAVFRDLDLGPTTHLNVVPETIYHPMVGVQVLADDVSIIANLGFRTDDRDGSDYGYDQELHGDSSLQFPLGPLTGNVALAAEKFHWGVDQFQPTDFFKTETAWTVSYGSAVALTWFTDYTDDPRVDTVGNLSENVYGAAELQVKPSSAVTLKAFYGAYKGGIRCSGGQCRLLPGFDGAKFTATATF